MSIKELWSGLARCKSEDAARSFAMDTLSPLIADIEGLKFSFTMNESGIKSIVAENLYTTLLLNFGYTKGCLVDAVSYIDPVTEQLYLFDCSCHKCGTKIGYIINIDLRGHFEFVPCCGVCKPSLFRDASLGWFIFNESIDALQYQRQRSMITRFTGEFDIHINSTEDTKTSINEVK